MSIADVRGFIKGCPTLRASARMFGERRISHSTHLASEPFTVYK